MRPHLRLSTRLALGLLVAGCAAAATDESDSSATRADSAGGLVEAPSEPYQPSQTGGPAALLVTVTGDSGTPGSAPAACKAPKASAIQTVFWVDGLRTGKPLPEQRRYDLDASDCGMEPRLQATVIGGTVNVFAEDGGHTLVFVRAGTTDTLQQMPFFNSASMVATDRLTRTPGIVEVTCAMHPEEKAYIAVFDHPYFGVAAGSTQVKLDSLPPGDYRIMTWHEGLPAPATQPARVAPSGSTEVVVKSP